MNIAIVVLTGECPVTVTAPPEGFAAQNIWAGFPKGALTCPRGVHTFESESVTVQGLLNAVVKTWAKSIDPAVVEANGLVMLVTPATTLSVVNCAKVSAI